MLRLIVRGKHEQAKPVSDVAGVISDSDRLKSGDEDQAAATEHMCVTEDLEVDQEILAYLVGHSGAQDTLEGIIEWWLLEQKIKRQTRTVRDALAKLVSQGLVVEHKTKDLRIHYRINSRKMKRILTLIEKKSMSDNPGN